ncbi:MAG: MFS transporter [Firmicutes bacterium]|jgi:MFS family permease|nr:MFS transporter [Bacillota bacterium]
MSHNLFWLYTIRAFRSFTTAFLTVAFPLYLAVGGYSAARIGWTLTFSGVLTAGLVVAVGFGGDLWGRRTIIILLGLLSVVGAGLLSWTDALWVVVLASGLGGVGRGGGAGSGGSWGPVFPAEQPLLAASVTAERRTEAFGRISFIGVMAGALGSLVAGLPAVLHRHGWAWLPSYHVLFALAAVISLIMVVASFSLRETPPSKKPAEDTANAPPISPWQLIRRLSLTNALNGLGFGFLGPLLTYWFYRRYHVGPGELAILYALINLVSAIPYLGAAKLSARFGSVRTVTVTRSLGLLMLLGMVWAPTFAWAGVAYALRMAFNSLGMPARQSFTMAVSNDRYRSRISAFSQLPSQVTSMISPAIGGSLMDAFLNVPIFGAVVFMGANVVAYWFAFRNVTPPEEQKQVLTS